jgi:hypothetical protein
MYLYLFHIDIYIYVTIVAPTSNNVTLRVKCDLRMVWPRKKIALFCCFFRQIYIAIKL